MNKDPQEDRIHETPFKMYKGGTELVLRPFDHQHTDLERGEHAKLEHPRVLFNTKGKGKAKSWVATIASPKCPI